MGSSVTLGPGKTVAGHSPSLLSGVKAPSLSSFLSLPLTVEDSHCAIPTPASSQLQKKCWPPSTSSYPFQVRPATATVRLRLRVPAVLSSLSEDYEISPSSGFFPLAIRAAQGHLDNDSTPCSCSQGLLAALNTCEKSVSGSLPLFNLSILNF